MNKAFVREAEDETAPKCPACRAIGQPVGPATLDKQLEPGAAAGLAAASMNFCPNPTCDVAYFDAHGLRASTDALIEKIWPKSDDPQAVLCPCLGYTAEQIMRDARSGDPTRVRQILAQGQSHPQRCITATPYGRACAGEAQRLYMKNLSK